MDKSKQERSLTEPEDEGKSFNTDTKNFLWEKIEHSIYRKKRQQTIGMLGLVATVFVVGLFFWMHIETDQDRSGEMKRAAQLSVNLLKHEEGRIQMLTLSKKGLKKGDMKLVKEQAVILKDSVSYVQQVINKKMADYKTVYVPYGMRQEVILEDGSKIWLNAGSFLTFPATFKEGAFRDVFLNGEAYFEIASNVHPFRVLTNDGTIQVLGTSFNVSCYEEDPEMLAALITGRIAFESENRQRFQLKPGQQLALNRKDKKVYLHEGEVERGMLWTKRQLALDRIAIPMLFKKLERIFNVHIHCPETLQQVRVAYSGRLSLQGSIENVLRSIYELKSYQIKINEKEVYLIKK
ncbi:FecR family protein [Olivibacter jilunii]|uniref:FecR family protein n=1 Tax=Olivibacter jilunii TaxID=985016 RepID=UPI003F18CF71